MVGSISGSAPYSYLDLLTGAANTPKAQAVVTPAPTTKTDASKPVISKNAPTLGLSPELVSLLQDNGSNSTGNGLLSQLLGGFSSSSNSTNPYESMLSINIQAMMYKGAYQGVNQKNLNDARNIDPIQKLFT